MSRFDISRYTPRDSPLIDKLEKLCLDERYIDLLVAYLPNTRFKKWCIEYVKYHKYNHPYEFDDYKKGWLLNHIMIEGYNIRHIFKILRERITDLND